MTLRISNFEAHLRMLERLKCNVIPLAEWVAWRRGERATMLPPRAVVLTADDGHRSQFSVMAPRLHARGWPVSLFVYPSAISNASYAMTWPQLRELISEPGCTVQSHSFWHPNLLQERRRMSPDAFQRFAADQLQRSREVIEQRLSQPVSLLAWPFGLSDEALWTQAAECGYQAAFALGNRSASMPDPIYAVPRHLIVDSVDERQLAARLTAAFAAGEAQ
jgi:peptidoglycan/xylan/chitin deacetylase (PgdA/CDA1 family)